MLYIKELTIRNFLSYGNVINIIDLNNNGTTIIKGENLDNTSTGSTSNGCGKSSIISALTYVLYDRALTEISKDNLINNINKKDMIVTVDFEKNKKTYHIERGRKLKNKGNYVLILENNKDITPDNINNSNELIEKIIGIPYDLFSRIVVFSAVNTSFLDLPVKSSSGPNQTNMIEHLFGLTVLTEKSEILKEHLKDMQNKIDGEKIHIEHLEKEYIRYNEQISSVKSHISTWELKQKNDILQLQNSLNKIKDINLNEQEELFKNIDTNSKNILELENSIKETESLLEHNEKILQQINLTQKRIDDWELSKIEKIDNITKQLINIPLINYEEQEKLLKEIEICQINYKQLESSIKETESLLEHNEKILQQINLTQKRIDDWELSKQNILKTYNDELNIISLINIEEQKELFKIFENNNQKYKFYNTVDTSKKLELKKFEDEKNVYEENLKHLLDHNCPYCHQEFHNTKEKIIENQKNIEQYNIYIKNTNDVINENLKLINDIIIEISKIENNLKFKNNEEIITLENKKNNIINKIKETNDNKNPHISSLNDLNNIEIIKEDDLNILKNDLQNNILKLNNYNIEIKNLKDKSIFKNLQEIIDIKNKHNNLQSKLSEINDSINPYLDSLNDLKKLQLSKDDENLVKNDILINNNKLNILKNEQKKLKDKLIFNNINELMEIKNNINNLKDKINIKTQEINPYMISLQELETKQINTVDYTKINEYNKKLEHQKFLQKLLTKKDSFIRKKLLEKYLPFLNGRLQKYISELGLPYKIEFNADLTANITSYNRTLEFGNLSHGQRSRVNIGLSFAFRDVLEKLYNKVNILLLDEILDEGLDNVGVQKAANMLKLKSKEDNINLFIISHREEICNYFDRNLTVQFINGFSQIKN